ncbi:MAG: alpha-hydroxy-acid oxidizing protein [Clostridiales bacterium]|nr:alpha-hydroxy-acid oxidizing protein [Clostridiales bacterium]
MSVNIRYFYPQFSVERSAACVNCRLCERECAFGVHSFNEKTQTMRADPCACVNCQRCVAVCPVRALSVRRAQNELRGDVNFSSQLMTEIYRQAESGGVLLSGMGNPQPYPVYWDKIAVNASQVTNPSIDPLREPMETRVFLGGKSEKAERKNGKIVPDGNPYLRLDTPILFSAMSYGSVSYNVHAALAEAAKRLGTFYNTGEGGLHRDFYPYGDNTIVQVASGRFGVHSDYLACGAAIEIKMGQGAKPGIGGHLPGKKIVGDVSATRMIPEGSDAISPAPHHDIYSIEDLRQLVTSLKEATGYSKPIIVKVAAVANIAAIASGIARSGADIIAIDGFRGGTGAAPTRIRDNVGIPIELALAGVDTRLREEGIRGNVSLIAGGSIRSSADVVKAIALGADAVYIGTAALMALGCHLCRSCHTGKCNWGIATQRDDLVARLHPEEGACRLVNLVTAWTHEIKEMMGGMGINSIEALCGNRFMLRGIGLNEKELSVLGIKHAGE